MGMGSQRVGHNWMTLTLWVKHILQYLLKGKKMRPYVSTCSFALTLDCCFGRAVSSWVAFIPSFEHNYYIPVVLLWNLKTFSPLAFRVTVGSQRPFFLSYIRDQSFSLLNLTAISLTQCSVPSKGLLLYLILGAWWDLSIWKLCS